MEMNKYTLMQRAISSMQPREAGWLCGSYSFLQLCKRAAIVTSLTFRAQRCVGQKNVTGIWLWPANLAYSITWREKDCCLYILNVKPWPGQRVENSVVFLCCRGSLIVRKKSLRRKLGTQIPSLCEMGIQWTFLNEKEQIYTGIRFALKVVFSLLLSWPE